MTAPVPVRYFLLILAVGDLARAKRFYDAAFGLKEIDRVGNPPTEIIMRFGATVAEAKAGASPEFLVQRREGVVNDPMHHAIFRVSDIAATEPSSTLLRAL